MINEQRIDPSLFAKLQCILRVLKTRTVCRAVCRHGDNMILSLQNKLGSGGFLSC